MGGFFDSIGDIVSGGVDFVDDLFGGGGDIIGSIGGWLGDLNPSIASAGIFSAASMVSELFGTDIQEDELDFLKDKFEQELVLSREKMDLEREQFAAQERMAATAAGATVRAAEIGAGAQLESTSRRNRLALAQTRGTFRGQTADRKSEAVKGRPELIFAGRSAQANQAQQTGQGGRAAIESLIGGIQRGLGR